MLGVNSTIYIHVLLFSEDQEQVKMVRYRLARNFGILTELLQAFWAALDVALSRLQTFHNACIQLIERSFCMDRWLLKFILEHGSSITERPLPSAISDEGQSAAAITSASADNWWNWFLQTL
jgi:hypothetical protein